MKRLTLVAIAVALLAGTVAHAGTVSFNERFALAENRESAIQELIPGSREFYYYTCLHLQHQGKFGEVEKVLVDYVKRYSHTSRVWEIKHRQALLTYDRSPRASLDYIIGRLHLHFNHQRKQKGVVPNLPTSLDNKLIARQRLAQQALNRYHDTSGFEGHALDWLAVWMGKKLNWVDRRHLLNRLDHPDVPGLVDLIATDLKTRHSSGFGAMNVHRMLTRAQLDELLKKMPVLRDQTRFVQTYLGTLAPSNDEDWQSDRAVYKAYLDRLWSYVQTLGPVHNSLKANVLYHRLVFDRAEGVYDRDRFMTYLKMPRIVNYMEDKYIRGFERSRNDPDRRVQMRANYRPHMLLAPIGNDEPLVRSYLLHFFADGMDYKPLLDYVETHYLKLAFAEAKIVNGIGDMEEWFSMITGINAGFYQTLKDRVDLDFAHTNASYVQPGQKVELDVHVKNVKQLLVKVYESNALNYYRSYGREVDTTINLDGLVANATRKFEYDDSPLRRIRRSYEFPELAEPGIYVVEFIGNGMSSRAMITKGRLQYLMRHGAAGQVFTVFDSANKKLPDAKLYVGGTLYEADEDGTITVPYTERPGREKVILVHGERATLESFQHAAESYRLDAGIHLQREQLLGGAQAEIILRPKLRLNGEPISMKVMEDVRIDITTTDQDGVMATQTVTDPELKYGKEFTHSFGVPDRLRRVQIILRGRVQQMSTGKKIDVTASRVFQLNGIEASHLVSTLYLSHVPDGWVIEARGRNGEALADEGISVHVKHRDFTHVETFSLKTDENGRVSLGQLDGIVRVQASGPSGHGQSWPLPQDRCDFPSELHSLAGHRLRVPWMGAAGKVEPEFVGLLEVRHGHYVKDWLSAVKATEGFLEITDLPAGDYELRVETAYGKVRKCTIRLTAGKPFEGYILGTNRHLEIRNIQPVQIVSAAADEGGKLTVQLANVRGDVRVHLAGVRFTPPYRWYADLGAMTPPGPMLVPVTHPRSFYVAGRDIGEEYRYILERRLAEKFPGNMLDRPSLLLNPWALRETVAGHQFARAGGHYRREADRAKGRGSAAAADGGLGGAGDVWQTVEFLASPAVVLTNLRPDKDGRVVVDAEKLEGVRSIHVIAVADRFACARHLPLADAMVKRTDRRLKDPLPVDQHFTQKKQITVLKPGQSATIVDPGSARLEGYDNIPAVYRLYVTLSNNADLREFGFIANWNKLDDEQKRAKYSKYACHELHVFLKHKDPAFFEKVIQPYLANKKDKTFIDHYLLGEDLRPYLDTWRYHQLNAAERIFLARALGGDQPKKAASHTADLWELIPPNPEQYNRLFNTAVGLSRVTGAGFSGVSNEMQKLAEAGELGTVMMGGQARDGGYSQRSNGGKTFGNARGPAGAPRPSRPGEPAPRPATDAPAEAAAETVRAQGEDREDAARQKSQSRGRRQADLKKDMVLADAAGLDDYDERLAEGRAEEVAKRKAVRQLYMKMPKTEEYAENNYYHLPIAQQNAGLIHANAFWKDYADYVAAGEKGGFRSENLAIASGNFPEMMLALAVLDLPFEPEQADSEVKDGQLTLKPQTPTVLFHEEIKPAERADGKSPILVSQNFYRYGERYKQVGNERVDKFVTEEFLPGVPYGCHIVLTNPTSSRQKLDVLLQVPAGSLPIAAGKKTRSVPVTLEAYHTTTMEFFFYFPHTGEFPIYPVHVGKDEKVAAAAGAFTFNVVKELSDVDKDSWGYISQWGTEADVIEYLRTKNLHRVSLAEIAWRMKDPAYFKRVIDVLRDRRMYDNTLWSYSLKHNVLPAAREFLQYQDGFVRQCGEYIDTELLTIDPVVRKSYQHLEYWPLVNARRYKLGKDRKIVNPAVHQQYERLMKVLTYRPDLDDDDLMAVTYYMFLQDRVGEALGFFEQVQPKNLHTRLEHEYFRCYAAFYRARPEAAAEVASAHKDHPVKRWRTMFGEVLNQVAQITGEKPAVLDDEDRQQIQDKLAATAPQLAMEVAKRQVTVTYDNLEAVEVNYYKMDIELLFSRNPFVKSMDSAGQFSMIRPNLTRTVKLPDGDKQVTFDLPEQLGHGNVLVEVVGEGVKRSEVYFASKLTVQLVEAYGQVSVLDAETDKPLPKAYVKVYARMTNGQVRFYKDGYTDLRGRFDYASLNTGELARVKEFAVLILSDSHGAVIREAQPPKE